MIGHFPADCVREIYQERTEVVKVRSPSAVLAASTAVLPVYTRISGHEHTRRFMQGMAWPSRLFRFLLDHVCLTQFIVSTALLCPTDGEQTGNTDRRALSVQIKARHAFLPGTAASPQAGIGADSRVHESPFDQSRRKNDPGLPDTPGC